MTGDTAPLILAFDTSAAYCAAALLSGPDILASRAEEMSRGQAERLMPMLQEMLANAGVTWRDLSALGVGVGPGNFTGIRIAVSAARGLVLGLEIPAYGVNGFDARAQALTKSGMITIPATRQQVYVLLRKASPALLGREDANAIARKANMPIAAQPSPARLAEGIARVAQMRWPHPAPAPAPLYVRPADATPSRDPPPVILD